MTRVLDPYSHAPDADDLDPASRIVYRARIPQQSDESDLAAAATRALLEAERVTRYGGVLMEFGRRAADPERSIHLSAMLSVAQGALLVYHEAQELVGGRRLPAEFAVADGGADTEARLQGWAAVKDAAAREIGVPRLAFLLERAGMRGDLDQNAARLWSACGLDATLTPSP